VSAAAIGLDAAARLLVREARLLDERRFSEWLELYADDASYWVPACRDDGGFAPDTSSALSLLRMDRPLLADWVARMNSGSAHVELPAVRVTRMIAGVEADDQLRNVFHCAWMMQTHTHGKSDLHSGRSRFELTEAPGTGVRIRRKEVRLIQDTVAYGYLPLV